MPENTFDIVSKIEMPEVSNAIQQAVKEIQQRFDLKGSNSQIELQEKDKAVFVAKVLKKSPASEAGLKKGDRILQADGKDVASVDGVLQRASKLTAGKTLSLTIERNNEKQELKITAGDGL